MVSDYDAAKLKAELTRDEARRYRIYTDTVGKVTGGIGRNLSDRGFQDNEIDLMYQNDIKQTEAWLDCNVPWWRTLDPVRQRVLMNMAFNMQSRLLTFEKALDATKRGDYATAASDMQASKWYAQVGARAARLCSAMRSGVMPVV